MLSRLTPRRRQRWAAPGTAALAHCTFLAPGCSLWPAVSSPGVGGGLRCEHHHWSDGGSWSSALRVPRCRDQGPAVLGPRSRPMDRSSPPCRPCTTPPEPDQHRRLARQKHLAPATTMPCSRALPAARHRRRSSRAGECAGARTIARVRQSGLAAPLRYVRHLDLGARAVGWNQNGLPAISLPSTSDRRRRHAG